MVYDRAEMVEQRRAIAPPARIVPRERTLVFVLTGYGLQQPEGWSEEHWPVAPLTKPSITAEDAHLEVVGERRSRATGRWHEIIEAVK